MAGWKDNAVMTLNGVKVTDHGRGPLSESTERIGVDKRMADGTLRRQHINLKRKWSVSWESLPSTNNSPIGMRTADGGMAGEDLEQLYFAQKGVIRMVLRRGSAINKTTPNPADSLLPYEDADFYIVNVMMTDFSKEVRKRGSSDIWGVSMALEEV